MAYAAQSHAAPLSFVARLSEMGQHASEAYKSWRVYRNTLNELRELNTRELNDLGLNRSMLRQIALEAAYGARD